MWRVWTAARTWRCRPSELLGSTDPWQSFLIDEAVALWGRRVESHVDRAIEAARNRRGGNPDAAARRALDEALGIAQARARTAAARPRRQYRYEVDASGLPRPVQVNEG